MRILFAGTPDIAVPSLEAIAAAHEVVGALTNPPAQKGRGLSLSATPVAEAAARLGIPTLSPERLGAEEREIVGKLSPEVLAVFAYGRIFGPKFLGLFPRGAINAHPSLLPRWRGPAPIQYAIMNRDAETGVCIQRMAREVDSGDVLKRRAWPLDGGETGASLSAKAAAVAAELFLEALADIEAGTERGETQDAAAATWSRTIAKEEGLVDWAMDAEGIEARARAFDPWPGLYSGLGGQRLSILSLAAYPLEGGEAEPGTVVSIDKSKGIMVQTGKGLVALTRLQLRGKRAMDHRDFANGARGLAGARLSAPDEAS